MISINSRETQLIKIIKASATGSSVLYVLDFLSWRLKK